MGFCSASAHDGKSGGSFAGKLSEFIGLFLAGANVWVVLVDVLHDLGLEFELEGEIPESTKKLPKVGSERQDHASEGVQGLEEVEGEISSHSDNDTLDEETSGVGHLVGGSLPSSWGHWNGCSFAGVRN